MMRSIVNGSKNAEASLAKRWLRRILSLTSFLIVENAKAQVQLFDAIDAFRLAGMDSASTVNSVKWLEPFGYNYLPGPQDLIFFPKSGFKIRPVERKIKSQTSYFRQALGDSKQDSISGYYRQEWYRDGRLKSVVQHGEVSGRADRRLNFDYNIAINYLPGIIRYSWKSSRLRDRNRSFTARCWYGANELPDSVEVRFPDSHHSVVLAKEHGLPRALIYNRDTQSRFVYSRVRVHNEAAARRFSELTPLFQNVDSCWRIDIVDARYGGNVKPTRYFLASGNAIARVETLHDNKNTLRFAYARWNESALVEHAAGGAWLDVRQTDDLYIPWHHISVQKADQILIGKPDSPGSYPIRYSAKKLSIQNPVEPLEFVTTTTYFKDR